MKFLRLSDWPLALKMGLAQAVALAVMTGLAITNAQVKQEILESLDQVVEEDLPTTVRFTELGTRIRRIHGDLYMQLTFQAGDIETDGIPARMEALAKEFDEVGLEVDELANFIPSQEQREDFQSLQQDLADYKGAVEWVGSMMSIDFASAASFLVPFEEHYKHITDAVEKAVKYEVSLTAEHARESEESAILANRITILAIVIVGLLSSVMVIGTRRSIRSIAQATEELAQGKRDLDLAGLARKDELGAIVASLGVLRENQERLDGMREEQEAMREQAEKERKATLTHLADGFEGTVSTVVHSVIEAIGTLRNMATEMTARTGDARQRAVEVANASDSTSMNVQTVASAAEELSASISEIGQQVVQSQTTADEAVAKATNADELVANLASAAGEIGSVIEMIDDIAAKTNLLALNATIEAARAGEAGRGFAVVASEVKALANQTAQATKEIGDKMASMQSSTTVAVSEIREVNSVINRISEFTTAIAGAIEQQNAATREMAGGINQASEGVQESSEGISAITQLTNDVGSASDSVGSLTENLTGQAEELRSQVERFLQEVRAA